MHNTGPGFTFQQDNARPYALILYLWQFIISRILMSYLGRQYHRVEFHPHSRKLNRHVQHRPQTLSSIVFIWKSKGRQEVKHVLQSSYNEVFDDQKQNVLLPTNKLCSWVVNIIIGLYTWTLWFHKTTKDYLFIYLWWLYGRLFDV